MLPFFMLNMASIKLYAAVIFWYFSIKGKILMKFTVNIDY